MPRRMPTDGKVEADQMTRECLAMRVRLLSRAITRIYDDALASLGLTANQLNILTAIEAAEAITPGGLARRLDMDKSTVSRTVARMIEHGWIEEQRNGDLRSVDLVLTGAGRRKRLAACPRWEQAQQEAAAMLGPSATQNLRRAGNAISDLVG